MKPKLDWEKIKDENLMRLRGAEDYHDERPRVILKQINCMYCGVPLKDSSTKVEQDHLGACARLYHARDLERIGNSEVKIRSRTAVPLSALVRRRDFPSCGRRATIVPDKTFTGRAVAILDSGRKIKLRDVFEKERIFDIAAVVMAEQANAQK